MKNENDILIIKNTINDLGYTGVGVKPSNKNNLRDKTPKIS